MSAASSSDDAVQATNNDAQDTKMSVMERGYFEDPFLHLFARQKTKKSPLINRGTWTRVMAVEATVKRFLAAFDDKPMRQIVSLGSGFDTLYFRLRANGDLADSDRYMELDFDRVVEDKVRVIVNHEQLKSILGQDLKPLETGRCGLSDGTYTLAGVDMRDVVDLKKILQIMDVDAPTLILAEVVLIYLPHKESEEVIRLVRGTFHTLLFFNFEQVNADDAFGKQMTRNIAARGSPLVGIYPHLQAQTERFTHLGFPHVSTISMFDFLNNYIPVQDIRRVNRLEPLDEFEECELLLSHYCIVWAFQAQAASPIDWRTVGRRRCRVVVCEIDGVQYRTGKKLRLREIPGVAGTGWVRCDECSTCYRVELPIPGGKLKCSECGHEWDAGGAKVLGEVAADREERERKEVDSRRTRKAPGENGKLNCVHFKKCSGCMVERGFERTPAVLRAQDFGKKVLKLSDVKVFVGDVGGWRTTARLAVRSLGRKPAIGLYEMGSHKVVPIPDCVVHHPQINVLVDAITKMIKTMRVSLYDEAKGQGDLRYLQFTVERSSGLVSITLVWNASTVKESNPQASRMVKELWRRREELKIHSIWLNLNITRGNAVLAAEPNRWKLLRGERMVREKLLDAEVYFLPSAFRQANLSAFETLLESLVKYVPDGSNVVEFCAGVGAIGLSVLSRRKLSSLLCTELNELSEDAFWHSVSKLEPKTGDIVGFEVGTAAALRDRLEDADIAIADPPRQGLDYQFLELLCAPGKTKPSRFIYVSCGLESFKKNGERLLKGGWKAVHSEAHLFFPGSDHVETLTVFDRVEEKGEYPAKQESRRSR